MNTIINKQYCNNCGKFGHTNKICKEPITSIGIVCIKLEDLNQKNSIIDKLENLDKPFNILKHNNHTNKFITLLNKFDEKIKFLMIKRKHSLGFLEFVRGRYAIEDYQGIIKLFELMTEEEINLIKEKEFNDIWEFVWRKTAYLKTYEDEYNKSRDKFELLKYKNVENNVVGLKFFVDNILPKWKNGEWGFPKGRRNYHEKNLACAIREFEEETGYSENDYIIPENILPIKEILIGTNGITYKHIYYIAIMNSNKEPFIAENNNEVGDISWQSFSSAIINIRNYHIEKKKILNEVFKFMVSIS
jgi:8-oxo-dGTP pyrophosphatase MutT (NUDIX family)